MAKTTDEMLNKMDTKLDDMSDAIHHMDKEVALQKAAFSDHVQQDEKMYDELKRMNDILQENTESLKEHMAQTQLLKDTVLKIDARLAPIEVERIEAEAVKKHEEKLKQQRKETLKKYGKILGLIGAAISVIVAAQPFLLKLLTW